MKKEAFAFCHQNSLKLKEDIDYCLYCYCFFFVVTRTRMIATRTRMVRTFLNKQAIDVSIDIYNFQKRNDRSRH